MNRLMLRAFALLLAVASGAHAASLLGGSRLAIVNKLPDNEAKNRINCLAHDVGIAVPGAGTAADPTCVGAGGGGGSITFRSAASGQVTTSPLPCKNWHATIGGAGYRYLDRELDDGVCRVVEVRQGKLLRARCEGRGPTVLGFDLTLGQAQEPVNVALRLGSAPAVYCLAFGGIVLKDGTDAKTFLAKNAPPPSVACSPSGAFLDGPARY